MPCLKRTHTSWQSFDYVHSIAQLYLDFSGPLAERGSHISLALCVYALDHKIEMVSGGMAFFSVRLAHVADSLTPQRVDSHIACEAPGEGRLA